MTDREMNDMTTMCCAFKCPNDFTSNYEDCETMNKPECKECKRLCEEAIKKYLNKEKVTPWDIT